MSRAGATRDRWLSPREDARYLWVSTRTLRRWEEAGELHPLRTRAGHRRYAMSELQSQLGLPARPRPYRWPLRPRGG